MAIKVIKNPNVEFTLEENNEVATYSITRHADFSDLFVITKEERGHSEEILTGEMTKLDEFVEAVTSFRDGTL
jgi:hypothetical protein